MDTRADFQRLLEDMDKVIRAKRQELSELDERLEVSRNQLSEKEANELRKSINDDDDDDDESFYHNKKTRIDYEKFINEQKKAYEQELEKSNEEFNELESMNQELLKENELLRENFLNIEKNFTDLKKKTSLLSDNLNHFKNVNHNLQLQITHLETIISEQQKTINICQKEKEDSISILNNKLESLNRVLASKDRELEEVQADYKLTLESFGLIDEHDTSSSFPGLEYNEELDDVDRLKNTSLLSIDKKKKVIEIASAFREKDEQIKLLQNQLIQATKDLERNASLLELLNNNSKFNDQTSSNIDINLNTNEQDKFKMLEDELEAKDRQLNLLEFKNHQYEIVMPNKINDLIQKLIDLFYKKTISSLATSNNNNPIRQMETNNNIDLDLIPPETIKALYNNLNNLLTKLYSTQELLHLMDKLELENRRLNNQNKNLVYELNRLHAKLNNDHSISELFPTSLSTIEDDQKKNLQKFSPMNQNESLDSFAMSNLNVENKTKTLTLNRKRRVDLTDRRVRFFDFKKSKSTSEMNNNSIDNPAQEANIEDDSASIIEQKEPEQHNKTNYGDANDDKNSNESNQKQEEESTTNIDKNTDKSVNDLIENSKGQSQQDNLQFNQINGEQQYSAIRSSIEILSNDDGDVDYKTRTNKNTLNSDNIKEVELIKKVEERLKEVKDENELLELAMKEILLSLKWSDAKCCTILIDCPSLERLCQLIEARYMASNFPNIDSLIINTNKEKSMSGRVLNESLIFEYNSNLQHQKEESFLFQLVVLKSELDLLRGQNEQLRADIKTHRREQLDLLIQSVKKEEKNEEFLKEKAYQLKREKMNEVECQTDLKLMNNLDGNEVDDCTIEFGLSKVVNLSENKSGMVDKLNLKNNKEQFKEWNSKKCSNCNKLNQLINHLLECIIRIQTRVQISDDNYIGRLLNLHKIIGILERDLSSREKMLSASRRECNFLIERKLVIESQLNVLLRQHQQQSSDINSKSTNETSPAKPYYPAFILLNNNLTPMKGLQKLQSNDIVKLSNILDDQDKMLDDSSLDSNSSNSNE